MENGPTRPPVDRYLVVEVAMVLLLVGLALGFFLVPIAGGSYRPGWWVSLLLGALFFGVVALHSWRRKRGGRLRLLRAELREKREGEIET